MIPPPASCRPASYEELVRMINESCESPLPIQVSHGIANTRFPSDYASQSISKLYSFWHRQTSCLVPPELQHCLAYLEQIRRERKIITHQILFGKLCSIEAKIKREPAFRSPTHLTDSTSFRSDATTIVQTPSGGPPDLSFSNYIVEGDPGKPSLFLSRFEPDDDDHLARLNDMIRREQWTGLAENYKLRAIPQSGFFCSDLGEGFAKLSILARYEIQRFAVHFGKRAPILNDKAEVMLGDYGWVWQQLTSLVRDDMSGPKMPIRTSERLWSNFSKDCGSQTLVLSGSLKPSRNSKSLLHLVINPATETKQSNRNFRKFGAERFFKLMIPMSSDIVAETGEGLSRELLEQRMTQWLEGPPKKLFSCQWVPIHVRPGKATAKQRLQNKEGRHEVMFFAISGPNLEPISRADFLDWNQPLQLNKDNFACKSFMRFDLGFSSTTPTVRFIPSQISETGDIMADLTADDSSLHDPSTETQWEELRHDPRRVMTDGCGVISYAAAMEVSRLLGIETSCPSAFQGRLGPYKGVWSVAARSITGESPEHDFWISTRPSQKKWQPHREDGISEYDPERLTFEVVKWTRKLSPSTLHRSFMPILEDRGVQTSVFAAVIEEALEKEQEVAFTPWDRPERGALDWLEERYPVDTTKSRGPDKSNVERARQLLLAGFDVRHYEPLAELMKLIMAKHFTDLGDNIDIPLPLSTLVIGVADPCECLAPDEIYLCPSDPDLFGMPFLEGDVVVSRHPALRASDAQRVRAVLKPQLKHLRNLVVFSSKGTFPLAGKLQGGDYDGDLFWICADQRIVRPFRNVPPPRKSPLPEQYGIEVDRTKLGHYLTPIKDVDQWFNRSVRFVFQESLLGQVANYYEKLRYKLGPGHLGDRDLCVVADIYDLIIDTAKNGYTYTLAQWSKQLKGLKKADDPLYKTPSKVHETDERIQRSTSCVDYVIFGVARPKCKVIQQDIEKRYKNTAKHEDLDVAFEFQQARTTYKSDQTIQAALNSLEDAVKNCPRWFARTYAHLAAKHATGNQSGSNLGISSNSDLIRAKSANGVKWDRFYGELQEWYDGVGEEHSTNPALKLWLSPHGRFGFTKWTLLKASALMIFWPYKSKLVLSMAADEICYLKANAARHSGSIKSDFIADLKVKRKHGELTDADDALEDAEQRNGSFVAADASRPKHPRLQQLSTLTSDQVSFGRSTSSLALANATTPSTSNVHINPDEFDFELDDFGIEPEEVATEPDTDEDSDLASDMDSDYASAREDGVQEEPTATLKQLSQGYSQLAIQADNEDMSDEPFELAH